MNRGISVSVILSFALSGCVGSSLMMGDVVPDKSPPLTLWSVPERPCPPDRSAIAAARAALETNHTAGSTDHD